LIRSASATDVPPNFITTVPGIRGRVRIAALTLPRVCSDVVG
jgi:hypothetical protein